MPPGISPALDALIELLARAVYRSLRKQHEPLEDQTQPSTLTQMPDGPSATAQAGPIADLPVLQRLCGLKQPAAVKRWLKTNGVAFMVQPDGRPVTTIDSINRALLGNRGSSEPDWSPFPGSRPKSPTRS